MKHFRSFCFLIGIIILTTRVESSSVRSLFSHSIDGEQMFATAYDAVIDVSQFSSLVTQTEDERLQNAETNVRSELSAQSEQEIIREVVSREKRSPSNDDQSQKINVTVAPLKDTNLQLYIHWAGKKSSIIVVLTKTYSPVLRKLTSSQVYFSYDYGANYELKMSSKTGSDVTEGWVSDFTSTKDDVNRYIFQDSKGKKLFTTDDAGRTLRQVSGLLFHPDTISVNPVDHNMVLALDKTSVDKALYKSSDFGFTWSRIQTKVKSALWGFSSGNGKFDKAETLYIQREEPDGTITVLKSDTYLQFDSVISRVNDFLIMNASMFATAPSDSGGNGKDLWIALERHSRFVKANFHTNKTILEYFVVDASDQQILICVCHYHDLTHLYISEPNKVDFTLSLENITYVNPENSYSPLSAYADHRFADIHKVNSMRSIYIANVVLHRDDSPLSSSVHIQSLITFDKGAVWEKLAVPAVDSNGDPYNCTGDECYLQLDQEYNQHFPGSRTSPMLSRPSAPGYVLAQGNVGRHVTSHSDLFFSANAARDWIEVLPGQWFFTWVDHGGVIGAVSKFGQTNQLYYSWNQGESWHSVQFYEQRIRVYGLMTEPGETSTVFTIFGSENSGQHSWVIVQVDVRGLLENACDAQDDYKEWSPADERGIACLMGSQTVFKRRVKHAQCYNGRNYDRPVRVQECECSRDDFECDVGFYSPYGETVYCEPDPNSTPASPIPLTCRPGEFYDRTKGYRKLAGDACVGGEENRYLPERMPCPVFEEQSFVLYTLGNFPVVYRLDLVSNVTVELFSASSLRTVAFDFHTNCAYWSSQANTNITRTCFGAVVGHTEAEREEVAVNTEGIGAVRELRFDWLTRNLYWINTAGRLFVANLNGSFIRTLKRADDVTDDVSGDVMVARTFVLDPPRGRMFVAYSGFNRCVINATRMDGGEPTEVTSQAPCNSPFRSLVYDDDKLYWIEDGGRRVMGCGADGSRKRTIYRVDASAGGETALTSVGVYKNDLMWTSSGRGIMRMDKWQGSTGPDIFLRLPSVTMLKAFSKISQTTAVRNPCEVKRCTQLCIPLAIPGHPGNLEGRCLCGGKTGRKGELVVVVDRGGHETCTCPDGQVMDTAGFCKASNSTCEANQFECATTNRCILSVWRCDHDDDCGDNSDELDCPYHGCSDFQFKCKDAPDHCIPSYWKCDHDNDCGDGSDEADCQYRSCNATTEFQCQNGRCKNLLWRCDGDNDCGDWSDERDCNSTQPIKCLPEQFQCKDGNTTGRSAHRCIPGSWVCDGAIDCRDHSDERNCSTTPPGERGCLPIEKRCANRNCVFAWVWCDGKDDCRDNSDETNCTVPTAAPPTTSPPSGTGRCAEGYMRCRESGHCYPVRWHCDGVNDCGDDSDEFGCPASGWRPHGILLPCLSQIFQFKCGNGQCIWRHMKCDRDNDCGDWSDEKDCSNYDTGEDNGCIVGSGIDYMGNRSYTKNGVKCQRWDVTSPHDPHYQPQDPHHNYCRDPDNDSTGPWCYTVDPAKRWDYCGIPHCSNSSGGNPDSSFVPTASPHSCPDGYMFCGADGHRTCILERYVCDGDDDCGNGMDERNCLQKCGTGMMNCTNGRCVSDTFKCNGADDCGDYTDEHDCSGKSTSCADGFFLCIVQRICMSTTRKCDGTVDCPGQDEADCPAVTNSTTELPVHGFQCADGSTSVPLDYVCDLKIDCPYQTDESNCHCNDAMTSSSPCYDVSGAGACVTVKVSCPSTPKHHRVRVLYQPLAAGHVSTMSQSPSAFKMFSSSQNSFDLKGLKYATRYCYQVVYKFTNFSLPPFVTSDANCFVTADGLPSPPTGVRITELDDVIHVTWHAPAQPNGHVTDYMIELTMGAKTITRTQHNTTSQTDKMDLTIPSPTTPTLLLARVAALTHAGRGPWTDRVQFRTSMTSSVDAMTSRITRTSVLVTWKSPDVGRFDHFRICVMGLQNTTLIDVDNTTLGFNLTQLCPDHNYDVTVTPLNSSEERISCVQNGAQHVHTLAPGVETPHINSSLSHPISLDTVSLVWSPFLDPLNQSGVAYQVEYGASSANLKDSMVVNTNRINVTHLPHNHFTDFRVRIIRPFVGDWSELAALSPLEDSDVKPRDLRADDVTENSVTLEWNSPFDDDRAGTVEYKVRLTDVDANSTVGKPRTKACSEQRCKLTVTSLNPFTVYRACVQIITTGSEETEGKPSNVTFYTGSDVPPPTALRGYNAGPKQFQLFFTVPLRFSDFYRDHVRGVKVSGCEGRDVTSPQHNARSCRDYHEMSLVVRSATISPLTPMKWYTLFLTPVCRGTSTHCPPYARWSFRFGSSDTYVAPFAVTSSPTTSSELVLNRTNVIAIVVSAVAVFVALCTGLFILIRRNRRLQQTYHAFMTSHYDPQSGEAFFVNDDDDDFDNGLDSDGDAETTMMISGFADDEPLIVA